jgi:AAA+ ATPase superfamily predicted ATPase
VLSGSDVTFFEQQVVGYAATNYGRRTGSLRISPFQFGGIKPFIPEWKIEDRIRAWAVFGGMPHYLNEIVPTYTLLENIANTILSPVGLLRDEPLFLLAQESRIRDRDLYMSVLRSLATGCTRLNEIASRISREPSNTRPYLDTLEEMGIVARQYPITAPHTKKVFYSITDPFLLFWFRFVHPFESRIATREAAENHLQTTIAPQLDHFVSKPAFEEICQQWTLQNVQGSAEVGRWWGSKRENTPDGYRNRSYEADVVVTGPNREVLALGSSKWSDGLHHPEELNKLETSARILEAKNPSFYFFDRSGFTAGLKRIAQQRSDIHLVSVGSLE